jgi:hypothetical protein
MKALMTAACFATVCAMAANAQGQGQGQGQGQQQPPTQQQRADTQSVTISGCLERDTAAAATTGQAGQKAQQAFKLTDVTVLSGAANIGDKAKEKEFRLQASTGVDLAPHVGHEVEVVGRVTGNPATPMPPASGTTGSGSAGSGSSQQQQQQQQQRAGQKDEKPLLMVSAVKMTATTCR